jgi:hypothetical protein
MQLWRRVCVTDPKAVKAITGKQYSGNSPKPYWIVERLTQEFGPCGIGWGFTILSERYERFGESESLHIAVVRFWYVLDGKRGELEQVGQTRGSYMTAAKQGNPGRFLVDEDAPKKSVTDALVKCASYLGFAGDIFSGRWDDSRYVAGANREWREREAAEASETAANDPARIEWLEAQKAAIFAARTVGELKSISARAVEFAASNGDSSAVDQIGAWVEEKKAQARQNHTKEAA